MFVTAWVEIRDDFDFERPDNVETLAKCGDIDVIPTVFKARSQANRAWRVYSLQYEYPDDVGNLDQAIEQDLERFKSENPGQTDVLGAWYEAGNMVGTTLVVEEVPNPEYTGEPLEIPNPDYQPDEELPDFDPRETILNPAWVPEFITVRSQQGVPLYPTPGYIVDYMPNGELVDAHRYMGQADKVMS